MKIKVAAFCLFFLFLGVSISDVVSACSPLDISWKLIGPGGGGRITAVTEDPANFQNLYMTINVGGARRSCNGGETWEIINRGLDYSSIGKSAQQLADIWVHPDGNLVLAAGLNGRVYAMDTGSSTVWTPIYTHPGGLDVHFSKFTSDPNDSNVVYLGVGSIQQLILGVGARRSGDYWPIAPSGSTILRFKWEENNKVWKEEDVGSIVGKQRDGEGDGNLNIYSIAVNPIDSSELWFATEKGLYKGKLNSPFSYTRVSNGGSNGLPAANDIHGGKIVICRNTTPGGADPNGTTMYFTALNLSEPTGLPDPNPPGGVFRSSDGGQNWVELTSGTRGLDNGNSNYFDIVIDPKQPSTVFLAQTTVEGDNDYPTIDGTLYRSIDGGNSWQNMIIRADPATTGNPVNCAPGWLQMDKYGPDFLSVSPSQQVVLWSIGGGMLFKGNQNDPIPEWKNILTKRVGTDTWTTTGSEAIALAYSIAIDPNNSDIVYLPYGEHSYFKSTDGGGSVKVLTTFTDMKDSGNKGDSGTLIVDELNSMCVYAATQGPHQQFKDGGVMYSSNGGGSWKTIGGHLTNNNNDNLPRGAMLDLMVEYDGSTRNLYVANYGNNSENKVVGGVYLLNNPDSNPIKYNWQKIFEHECTHAIAARDNFTTLFVGVDDSGDPTTSGYGIYKLKKYTDSSGAIHWQIDADPTPYNLNGSKVFYDMETGGTSGRIYVATDIGLFAIEQNNSVTPLFIFTVPSVPTGSAFPVLRSAVEVHPKNEDIIYLAYDKGEVLKSKDRGGIWEVISDKIPTQGFVTLKLDPNSDTIYVAGPGSGVWKKTFGSYILP